MREERGSRREAGSWSRNNANGARRSGGIVSPPTSFALIPPFPSPSKGCHTGHSSFCIIPAHLVKVCWTPAIVYSLLRSPDLPRSSLKVLAFFLVSFLFFSFFDASTSRQLYLFQLNERKGYQGLSLSRVSYPGCPRCY